MVCALQVIFVLNEKELGAVGSRSQYYASFQSPWSEWSSPRNSWEVSSLCLPLISPPETAAAQAALYRSACPGGQESRRGLAASCPPSVYCWASGWAGSSEELLKRGVGVLQPPAELLPEPRREQQPDLWCLRAFGAFLQIRAVGMSPLSQKPQTVSVICGTLLERLFFC